MHDINFIGEHFKEIYIDNIKASRIRIKNLDAIQYVLNSYVNNLFFPWVCLILLLNKHHWKRPVIMILVAHWFLRSTGDLLRNIMKFSVKKDNTEWPYSITNWYVSNAVAHIFWLSGEIIGDWYPLLRTKAIIKNERKIKPICYACLFYNFIKIIEILCDFVYAPKTLEKPKNGINMECLTYKIYWWTIIMFIQIASLLYDLSVILALKNQLFDKIKSSKYNNNKFIDKFKQISEYRIIISIIISLIFFPVVFSFVIYLVYKFHSHDNKVNFDGSVEQWRSAVLNFNYTFMYIDQILLRFYVSRNKSSNYYLNSSSSSSQSHHPSSRHPINFIYNSIRGFPSSSYPKYINLNQESDTTKISNKYQNCYTINFHNIKNSSYYLKNLSDLMK